MMTSPLPSLTLAIEKEPPRSLWTELTARPAMDVTTLFDTVRPIVDDVRQRGDAALLEYEARFDRAELQSLRVSREEMDAAAALVSDELKCAIRTAHENIARFHSAQRFAPITTTTAPGVVCEQRAVPIERVGLYIPGGSAPLFSTVLMLAVPAVIADCKQIVLCSPPTSEGATIAPAILYTAQLCGVTEVFKLGGSQAIAAMACGTESVPRVDKIFGPGNQYVMAAKQWVSLSGVAIDMPAGPSEVEVIADASCRPAFVAADLLSQAEHGPDSQVVLVTTDESVAQSIAAEVERQLALLPRRDIAARALANSRCVVFADDGDIVDFTNAYAPEHLIIATERPRAIADRITAAGSVFVGHYACESAGDYASGTNHTLPTLGYARSYSGLCLDSFQRKMTLQELTPEGIASIGPAVVTMARGEQLDAHANAMALRLAALESAEKHTSVDGDRPNELDAIDALVRPNIVALAPYSCARDEFKGGNAATVFLDANESPYCHSTSPASDALETVSEAPASALAPINRYPDPLQMRVKERIAELKGMATENIFLGNGSDEAIDLIFRVFCRPSLDNIIALAPSYGMYEVCAEVNDVECRKVQLRGDYSFCPDDIMAATDEHTKAVFLCSPNNPTGNLLTHASIKDVLHRFPGIVVVDEAYIDFCPDATWRHAITDHPRLIVLSTFSKAWASAGMRLGMAFAHSRIISYFNKVKYPYNVNTLTQQRALAMLDRSADIDREVATILAERSRLRDALEALPIVQHVYPSDANFLLVRVNDATATYRFLAEQNIVVRNRNSVVLCEGCLRITVGTPEENDILIKALQRL